MIFARCCISIGPLGKALRPSTSLQLGPLETKIRSSDCHNTLNAPLHRTRRKWHPTKEAIAARCPSNLGTSVHQIARCSLNSQCTHVLTSSPTVDISSPVGFAADHGETCDTFAPMASCSNSPYLFRASYLRQARSCPHAVATGGFVVRILRGVLREPHE